MRQSRFFCLLVPALLVAAWVITWGFATPALAQQQQPQQQQQTQPYVQPQVIYQQPVYTDTTSRNMGQLANNLRVQLLEVRELILIIALVLGMFLFLGGLMKLRQHVQQPTAVPLGIPAIRLLIGILLIVMPAVILLGIDTIFGDAASTSAQQGLRPQQQQPVQPVQTYPYQAYPPHYYQQPPQPRRQFTLPPPEQPAPHYQYQQPAPYYAPPPQQQR